MNKTKSVLLSISLSLLLVIQAPLAVLAEETTTPVDSAPTEQVTSPAPEPAPAPSPAPAPEPAPAPAPEPAPAPKLPDKPGYVFNDAANKWEAANLDSFTWDAGLGRWVSPLYWYDGQVGWYHVNKAGAVSAPIPTPTAVENSSDPQAAATAAPGGSDPSNSNTGPLSQNSSTLNSSNSMLANLSNLASVTNNDTSAATSGAANSTFNNFGGSATTGPATVVANYLNLLNSMWSWGMGNITTFIYNIFGNHVGDLNITIPKASGGGGTLGGLSPCNGPNSNTNTGPLSLNTATTTCDNSLTGNNNTTGAITNNIDLTATSGDANVQNNTNGGDATSGDATANLNIVNMINSSIGAGQMFFGIINIFGSLDGDILFPGMSLDQAIAGSAGGGTASNSNTGPGSTNTATSDNDNNANLSNSTTGAFNNNIDANATSGDANVSSNTNAGSATSGQADTNTNTFNLFNTNIFGENAVLVLINDMGRWVGRIMNLPGGSSGGALLTSGATVENNNTGPGSDNTASSSNNNDANLTNNTSGTITNNVNASATSGDANVSNNTNAGSAKTGNAKVATNIANIFGSNLSFGGIFGILIVNVFGSWTGSVGVDTAAGNGVISAPVSVAAINQAQSDWKVYSQNQNALLAAGDRGGFNGMATNVGLATLVIASESSVPVQVAASHILPSQEQGARTTRNVTWLIGLAGFMMVMAAGLAGLERKLKRP
jgi:hypothetical protein